MITSKALFLQNLNQEYISDVDGYQPRQLLAVFNETFTNQSVFLGNSTSFDFNDSSKISSGIVSNPVLISLGTWQTLSDSDRGSYI